MNSSRWRQPNHEPEGHSHRLPGWLFVGLAIIVLGLVGGILLVSFQAIATNNRLTALEQYVAGKGEQRDAENAAQNQRIDAAVCSVLDQLPAGGRLDVVREQYRCGPGVPAQAAQPTTARATSDSQPDRTRPRPDPATTTPAATPTATRTQPPAAPTAAQPSTSQPAPGPVTQLVCGLVPQLCPTP